MLDTIDSPISDAPIMSAPFRVDAGAHDRGVARQSLRVAFYSHDTMGLGHLRRNLLIAESLANGPNATTNLMISGAVEANFFRLPHRTDCLTLPRWSKDLAGSYSAGRLDMGHSDLIDLRGESIRAAVQVFRPDVLVVDKVAAGAFGELLPTLRMLRERGTTRVVLGVRDVLDSPEVVRAEWLNDANRDVIDRYYDQLWIYGDQAVYDAVVDYEFPAWLAEKSVYTGFIDQSRRIEAEQIATRRLLSKVVPHRPLAACLVGGGQDGFALAEQFIHSITDTHYHGVVVGGPLMPADQLAHLQRLAARRKDVTVFDFLPESDVLVERADRVVAMGGYNTVCSVLSFRKNALLVPRIKPRREQWLRAKRLEHLGLVDVADEPSLSPAVIRRWLDQPITRDRATFDRVNLRGLAAVDLLVQRLASKSSLNGNHHQLNSGART